MRHRHATVAQLRKVFEELEDADVICTDVPATGNIPVVRDNVQIGVIAMAPQDLNEQGLPPSASFESLE